MNSILRHIHIRANDLQNFIRSYDLSSTTAVSIWAKAAANELSPGTLIFILEPVTLPFGLISFVRKEEEENFRVTDFAMVVRLEDNKAMALNITNSNYELRFLEALVEERVRKAVIDRKRFSYVAARPAVPLMASAFKELERLANLYAKSGSRRAFTTDNTNSQDEPAMALLTASGVHMQNPASNKQPLDIGLICQALFASEGKQQDGNRTQLQSAFIPIQNKDSLEAKAALSSFTDTDAEKKAKNFFEQKTDQYVDVVEKAQSQEGTGFDLLQSWGGTEKSNDFIGGVSLFTQITDDFAKEKKPLTPEDNSWADVIPNLSPKDQELNKQEIVEQQETLEPSTNNVAEEDVYKHLSDAITDLLGSSEKVKQQEIFKKPEPREQLKMSLETKNIEIPVKSQGAEPSEAHRMPAARSFEKLPAFTNPLTPSIQPSGALNAAQQKFLSESENRAISGISAKSEREIETNTTPSALTPPENEVEANTTLSISTKSNSEIIAQDSFSALTEFERQTAEAGVSYTFENLENFQIDTGEQTAIFSAADIVPNKLDDFQEPKVVMNEMASLMNKLESQVARAAKKLAIKANEVEQRLTTNLDTLLNMVIQEDKDAYAELVVRGDSLAKQFESLFDNLKAELAEKGATSREKVKATLTDNQKQIQDNEKSLRGILTEEFKQNQTQFKQLVDNQEKELNKLVSDEIEVFHNRLETIDQFLEEISTKLGEKLADYFNGFKSRVDDKVTALTKAFDYQMEILNKDIQSSHGRNTEKLKSSKEDFFASLDRLIKITEIALSRQIRTAQTEFFLPRLKERKQIVEAIMQEMTQTFAEHSFSQAKAQSEGAENSLALARQQLKELVEERLAKLDMVGRNQQAGLEEIFKLAANPLEQKTSAVVQLIQQAEQEVGECESVCNKLAEAYNLDSDPKLTALRQDVYNKVDSLKAQLKSELDSVLDSSCTKLEDKTKQYNVKLSAKRVELVQQVRQASDKGLQNIRQAIHDAYDTVQSQREKHME